MKGKTSRLNLAICGLAFAVMIFYAVFGDGVKVISSLNSINPLALAGAAALVMLYWLIDGTVLHSFLKPVHPAQKLRHSLSVAMLGQYYNCITPFASGGQPLQAYRLNKAGVPLGVSMTALLAKFITYQFTLTIVTAGMLIARMGYFEGRLRALTTLMVLSFAVNTVVLFGLLALAFFPRFSKRVAYFAVILLGRLKILKKYKEKLAYLHTETENFREKFNYLKKNPLLTVKCIAISIIQLLAYMSIAYALYLGLPENTSCDWLTVAACQSFVLLVSAFMPLPGSMGAAEGSYAAFMGGIFGGNSITFSMLVWRFLTFYLPIIIGVIMSARIAVKEQTAQSPDTGGA